MKKYIILTYLYDETDKPELVYNEVEAKSLEEAYEYADVFYNSYSDKIVILKNDLIKLFKELK
jgi:hypothetical protein